MAGPDRGQPPAVAVGNRIRAERGLPPRHAGHYNFWLLYGLLQTGREDQARALLEAARAERRGSNEPPPGPLELDPDTSLTASLVQMWARQPVETRDWDSDLLEWEYDFGAANDPALTDAWVRTLAAFRRGDTDTGARWRDAFERRHTELAALVAGRAEPMPTHGIYLERLAVLVLELDAAARVARGDVGAALALAAEASARESAMPAVFGPPFVDYPAAEFHADLLREAGRHREAVAAYRMQLERSRGRLRSLLGLRESARTSGDIEALDAAQRALSELGLD